MNQEEMNNRNQLPIGLIDTDQDKFREIIEEYEKIIQAYFNDNHFQSFYIDNIEMNNQKIGLTVTIAQEKYFDKFLIINDMQITPSEGKIESFSHIARFDGEPYVVEQKYLKLLLAKYFVRVNSTLRFGCLALDPESGLIKIKMNSLIQQQNLEDYQFPEKFRVLLKQLHQTNHSVVSFQIYKILHLINQLSLSVFAYLDEKLKDQYRKINGEVETHLNNIKKILDQDCTTEFDQNKKKYNNIDQYFKCPKQSGNTMNVISKIHINDSQKDFEENIKKSKIASGGFGDISRFHINYQNQNINDSQSLKRSLVVKSYRNSQSGQNNEKEILKLLEKEEWPFIAKYYYTDQKEFQDYLFIENYQYGNLSSYKTINSEISGINTKLYILYQVAMGLYFLKCHKIVHIDLKPGNVVIGKNLNARIIDFGESQQISNRDSDHKSGYTLPYIAPEKLQKNQQLSHQMDVFSFGMMMYELLFDDFPVDFRKNNLQDLQDKYKNESFTIRINENFIKEQGPKHLMKLIRIFILKCLEVKSDNRPKIEWIIVLIREMMNYLEKLY